MINKGDIAELKVQLRAIEKGYSISKPITVGRYDLIIDTGNKLVRAQIKHCSRKCDSQGAVELKLYRFNKKGKELRYLKHQIDQLLVYIPFTNSILSFGPEIFHNRRTLVIRYKKAKNNGGSDQIWYEDFLW